jgi:hypothetical protein
MIVRAALVFVIAATPLVAQPEQEKPKVPKDSIMATITGCLKGRVIRAEDVRQADASSGVEIRAHSFRVAGKKDLMAIVKENDGRRVQMTGIIKKSSLIEPGMRFKGGRVVVGGGASGGTGALPSPAENVVVIDAMTVTAVGGSCGG